MAQFPKKGMLPVSVLRCLRTAEVMPPHDFNSSKSRRLPGPARARRCLKWKDLLDMIWKGMPIEWNFRNRQIKIITVMVLLMGRNLTKPFLGRTNICVNSWITYQPHLVGDSGWPYLAPGESRWKVCSFRQRNPTSSGGCCKTLAPW